MDTILCGYLFMHDPKLFFKEHKQRPFLSLRMSVLGCDIKRLMQVGTTRERLAAS
jgi:hypothetical protein